MRTSHIFLRQGVVDVAVLAIVKIGEGVRMTGVMVITTESEVGPTKIPTLAEAEVEDVVADVVVAAAVAAAEMVAVMVAAVAVTVVAEAEDVAAEESQDSIVTIVHLKAQVVVVGVAETTSVLLATTTIEVDKS